MIKSKWFDETEFQRCSPACSLQDMKQEAMDKLDAVREDAGIPLVITSAYRSPAWDRARGRSGTGAHTLGLAIDIRCNSSTNRWKIINAMIKNGFTRIGIDKTFIHGDISTQHSQEVIWMY